MREPPTNICPLLAIAGTGTTGGPAVCLGERCAWAYDGDCAITVIAQSLSRMSEDGLSVIGYAGGV